MKKPLSKLLTLIAVIAFLFSSILTVHTQNRSAGPVSRESLAQSIKNRAEQDVDAEGAKATAQDLNILFGKEAEVAGMSMQEVMESYNQAYRVARQSQPWWKGFLPNIGWILSIILFLLLIIQETVRKAIAAVLDKLLKKIYRRAAGYKVFQQKALRNYQKALIKKYQHFKIPFRSDRDLDMTKIYIPLKIKGSNDTDLSDDLDIAERFNRIVVIGAPGSGKSMLMRRIALSKAFNKNNNQTPVVIDLRRFNEGDKSILEHLIEIMELNDFPNAGVFLETNLNDGNLLLLFDGLDEVANIKQGSEPTKREITVRKIIDLLDKYEKCPTIITCRTAVYRRDFDEIAERTLEIVEFSDQQIQNFLLSWPEPSPDKPIEQLIASLSERPAILALARNPLLLTIVAFLYTDMEEFVLPYSRAEFYTQAVDVLLQQLKGKLNRYRLAPKLLVLQRLALFNQEKDSRVADRLTIDEPTVVKLINELLPSLSLDSKDVTPLIEEIVERSNLLLEVDNKTKYQFFHLTLQEFFAAKALENDPKTLVENFRANKDAWRETVKLWCGLPHNSTELIKNVYKIDSLTAFECLADTPMVDQATADMIIAHHKPLLGKYSERSAAITKAFAGVAAGRSQRAGAALSFLMQALNTSKDALVRKAAAEALALSNKQEAVVCLSNRYDSDSAIVEPAIVKMGNVAVTRLKQLAENEHVAAVNALHAIGTTKGITALIPLLWHSNEQIQRLAALKLAETMSRKNGVESLRSYLVTPQQKAQPWYDWVWTPFTDSSPNSVPVIMGRIAYLLDTFKDQSQVTGQVEADWRVVVPLVLKEREQSRFNLHAICNALTEEKLEQVFGSYEAKNIKSDLVQSVNDRRNIIIFLESYLIRAQSKFNSNRQFSAVPMLTSLGAPRKLSFLIGLMSPKTQLSFLPCLFHKFPPSLARWQYIRRPKKPLPTFWPYSLLLLVLILLSVAGLKELNFLLAKQSFLTWKGILYTYLLMSIPAGWILTGRGFRRETSYFHSENLCLAVLSWMYPVLFVFTIRDLFEGKGRLHITDHLLLFSSGGFAIVLTYFSTTYLLRFFSGTFICVLWLSIALFLVFVLVAVLGHLDRYDNPLRKFAVELQEHSG